MKNATAVICLLLLFASCRKEEDRNIVIRKDRLSGVVQKGPYTRATVTLYELDENLDRTGNSFNLGINGRGGLFEMDNVALASEYTELKANGYYFNEISGAVSSYHLSLNAISNISDRSLVNINLLTHLESERVRYLVQNGYDFESAEDTARQEILSIFGMDSDRIDSFEKLNITESGEGNAFLLAASVILQGDRGVKELTELLNFISARIRENGKIESDSLIKELRKSTFALNPASIKSNLEEYYKDLGISASIPDIDKYLKDFLAYTGFAPTGETMEPTNITPVEATLNGRVNANDLPTTVFFEYGSTTEYGKTISASNGPVDGHEQKSISADLSGLEPGKEYHFRIKAINPRGTFLGQDMIFKTLGSEPLAFTLPPITVTGEGATLFGTVNPNNLTTTVSFQYGQTEAYGSTVILSEMIVGSSDAYKSAPISNLSPSTLYHYRITASNLLGTAYGNDRIFTTLGNIPIAVTTAATNISITGATLNATVNPNDVTTSVIFEYGLTDSYGDSTLASPYQSTGNMNLNTSANISGLSPGTLYHYRVKARNSLGTAYGDDLTFTTSGGRPEIKGEGISYLLTTEATLSGYVNANYLSTTVTFEYGTGIDYGNSVAAVPGQITGNGYNYVAFRLTGLSIGTEYHFRIKAVNSLGTTFGKDIIFETPGSIPTVSTVSATDLRIDRATLTGQVNAQYLATDVFFEYGLTNAYGNTVNAIPARVLGHADTDVEAIISGLSNKTTYYYRIKATNILGTVYSPGNFFTTLGDKPYAETGSTIAVKGTTATLRGIVNANGFSTTVIFEFGETSAYGNTVTLPYLVQYGTNTAVSTGITGLKPQTTYHYRVRAENTLGLVYGNDNTFTTQQEYVYDSDGNSYSVVLIGNQVWMGENLKATRFNDNTPIELITDNVRWASQSTPACCRYFNEPLQPVYGVLYNWYTIDNSVNGGKNVCPAGWHVSTADDWSELVRFIGGGRGERLMETGLAHWISPNSNANNDTGFTAVPGGERDQSGSFINLGTYCYFLTPGMSNLNGIWVSISYNYSMNLSYYASKKAGASIRCVKDR